MSCCAPEEPVKRIDVTFDNFDFWRSNNGATLPDGITDHTEEISHNGPIVVGGITGTAGKIATLIGDIDVMGQIDPNSIVFSDAPVGVVTAFDSTALGYYKIGVIGTQRVIVLMPKADAVDAVQVRQADGATVVLGADTLNKRVGVNTATPQASFDVNGAVIHRLGVTLPNFTANGAIGTAAATVNITSVIAIAQTTAGIALTLPNPTQTQAGRLLLVANTGSQPVTVGGASVANGKMLPFLWTGTAWLPVAAGGASDDFFRSGTAAVLLTPDGTADFTDTISHNGNAGFGLADPSTVAARLDVSGAEILRPVTLTNFAANAAIGTAAATVNIASTLIIPQTTTGITVTLPAPTNTQAGRLLFVENTGTADLIVDSSKVGKGTMLPFQWSGTVWIPVAAGGSDDFFRSGTAAALVTPDGTNDFTESISHNGNLGLGIADPSTVRARLDVSGAEILRPVALANFAANAAVGTAAATVDIASIITLNQATSNQSITIPNPTNTTAGRLLIVVLNGVATGTKINSFPIATDKNILFVWDGNSWDADSRAALNEWQLSGNASTSPSAYNDAGAQGNNFLGTTDNQNVSIYTNASSANAKTDLLLYTATPTTATVTAPVDVFQIRRNGQSGVTYPQSLAVALGHWWTDGSARTRADFKLGNGNVYRPDTTMLTLFSQGGVGINGNGGAADWAWGPVSGGIGRGNGGALLALMGANGSNNVGPHIGAWTTSDTYPIYYQLNWQHDNVAMLFDSYFDGTWRYAHTSRPYAIYKNGGNLNFYGSTAAGVAGNAWTQDLMARFRYAGATLAGGELDFNNIVKNRRIVLWDADSASDHRFYGFGINASTLRYQTDSTASNHVWFAAATATTSNELMRLTGTGNLGIGTTPVAKLDVNGSVVFRATAIADIAANGAVGTAAATVDNYSTLVLNQTTANISLTLPNPTDATAGRILFVTHNGTASGTNVAGRSIATGETLQFTWDGNSWNGPAVGQKAYVYCTSTANNPYVNNVLTNVTNWTEVTDTGNNHAVGVFTAPRSGRYAVDFRVSFLAANWAANTVIQTTITVNGANRHQGYVTSDAAGNKLLSGAVSATLNLTVGQTISFSIFQNSGANQGTDGGLGSFYTIAEF